MPAGSNEEDLARSRTLCDNFHLDKLLSSTSTKGEPAKHARAVNGRQSPTTEPGKDFQKKGSGL